METSVDLVIIGAGTAGISAFKEASKVTNSIVMIDHGPLGTTCARVGCMPSKVLLQIADSFHERHYFKAQGINGADALSIDIPKAMEYVRSLRDYFTSGVIKFIESLGNSFIAGSAELVEPNVVKVNNKRIKAKRIIIATGDKSIIPASWSKITSSILTSETIFEQENFKECIAVIGGGAIGLELGQALSRLNIDIALFHSHQFIGKISDPAVNAVAMRILRNDFPIYTGTRASIDGKDGLIQVSNDQHTYSAKQVLATLGRKPNFTNFNFSKLGVPTNDKGMPVYNSETMQIGDSPLFIAGDVDHDKAILHEAADEGTIAGYNAVRDSVHFFKRRSPLNIIFTQPNIALVGRSYSSLDNVDIIIGEVCFDDQGRSRIMHHNKGVLRIYAKRERGELLGAEMIAPAGEHLAHLLSLAIQQKLTVIEMLYMPIYHPVVEEGLRTALRHLAKQVTQRPTVVDLLAC